ncbi:MAG: UDP-N-acetylmuramoyl-L-alanyl-D-glutamate--2,6-diaminopimelate ligase [Candidatus Makaraimicrobium thalassicum]|nr:MAG: UDP-N-acetylmuramoyl-L-alanyl-D-glutamate--2,6-diaminopimelate ligase [Candidatus Omnitrophota bacterium]
MDNSVDTLLKTQSFSEKNIKTDSREVEAGDVFVAIKGTVHDGHDYIREVLEKGASRVLCGHEPPGLSGEGRGRIMIVEDPRVALGHIARDIFKDPSSSLSVYGVTGTNGKTTTVFLIDSVLNNAGRASGLVSTVFTKTSGDILIRSSMTTPDLITLNRLLSEMIAAGRHAAVIEISSHALDQQRVWGIGLDSAVFTNITPEHLDYHGDMATYLRDKSRIFRNLKPDGTAVLNLDDPMVIGLRETMDFPRLVTFGMRKGADVSAGGVRLSAEATEFDLIAGRLGSRRIRTGLIGEHNIRNILAATAALLNSGLGLEEIKEGVEKAPPVPGRLDSVRTSAPFRVFVDYAHTPNALEAVLRCLRSLAAGKLICVFGCGGDRDRTKRPVMGGIATAICDRVILTSDNPRTEDPGEILRQIEKGVSNKNNYSIIEQRQEAIRESLEAAVEGDIVIIAGKGHEDCQIIGETTVHFDDKEIAGDILKGLGY